MTDLAAEVRERMRAKVGIVGEEYDTREFTVDQCGAVAVEMIEKERHTGASLQQIVELRERAEAAEKECDEVISLLRHQTHKNHEYAPHGCAGCIDTAKTLLNDLDRRTGAPAKEGA